MHRLPLVLTATFVTLLLGQPAEPEGTASPERPGVPELTSSYLERWFATFPSQATAAGRHDRDLELEDLSPERRREWIAYSRQVATELVALQARRTLSEDDRLDAALLVRKVAFDLYDWDTLERPERDPLLWTDLLANANVSLLVRQDRPAPERLAAAAARARQLPRLARQAREALAGTPPGEISAEITRMAAGQVAAIARFYREGFAAAAAGEPSLAGELARAGAEAAPALEELAGFLEDLGRRATGSPLLGPHYEQRFRLATGQTEPLATLLARAHEDLAAKVAEAATYGRGVWASILPDRPPPEDDKALLAALFARLAEDRAETTEELVADYLRQVDAAFAFVRDRQLMTLPEPRTLWAGASPPFFAGQSVGGVYPAGPWAPEATTLWFLPTPSERATPAAREAFFRDFNHHFNVMITPHEIVPGHYTQLKLAARHPRKVRALFPDGPYVEGWGTFCERLMLDLGWGGPLDRLAHFKKQLENAARTIVDIRVHTEGMTRSQVLRFVREEALQDEQFAANMWARAIATSPQLTFYHLGYRQVHGLYEEVRAARGSRFELRAFLDAMMELGPVPVARYRERLLGDSSLRGNPAGS
ncbi:MAG TPA: DUF885 family protein [Thermoanaerobaculia bacterium]|nr:DUF885 family protein [Thermoanaerobaculia bacterium]